MAAPTLGNFVKTTSTSSTQISLTKPSGASIGDLYLILVTNDYAGSITQWNNTTNKPSGFTFIVEGGSSGNSNSHIAAFYRIVTGSEGASVTCDSVNTPAGTVGWYIHVSGNADSPINVTGTPEEAEAISLAIDGVVTTVQECLAFYLQGFDGGDETPFSVSGTGWTEQDEGTTGATTAAASGSWGTKTQTLAGNTGDATVTAQASDGIVGVQFAIEPKGETVTVNLVDKSGNAQILLSTISWAWFDEDVGALNAATDKGSVEVTDSSGELTLNLLSTTLTSGLTGTLVLYDSTGGKIGAYRLLID
jgi:hypothetical protein